MGKKWPVGETVNTPAFHAGMHGFEPRTGHHFIFIVYCIYIDA